HPTLFRSIEPRGRPFELPELDDPLDALVFRLPAAVRPALIVVERPKRRHRTLQPIEVADDPLVASDGVDERGIGPEIVEPAARPRGAEMLRDAREPARHRHVRERPQRSVYEEQR